MILKKDKTFETHSNFPSTDWYNEGNLIIDETTEEGQQMAQTYINNYPFVDFNAEGQQVTEVIILDMPEKPVPTETQEVQLVKNEQGVWEYILVEKELTELEQLKQQVEEQKALINAMLGVTE